MIMRCHSGADPAGRWKKPPAMIFCDPYAKGAAASDRGYVHACRDHLSGKYATELAEREATRGWAKNTLR
jgi:hypothetical protein